MKFGTSASASAPESTNSLLVVIGTTDTPHCVIPQSGVKKEGPKIFSFQNLKELLHETPQNVSQKI